MDGSRSWLDFIPSLTGPLRIFLGMAVGYLETTGAVTHDQGQQLTGAVIGLAIVAWSAWQNWRNRSHVTQLADIAGVNPPKPAL